MSYMLSRSQNEQTLGNNNLLKVLLEPSMCIAFRKFLSQQFADENLKFWLDVENFSNTNFNGNIQTFMKQLDKIFDTYCKEDSPLQVNIDVKRRKDIIEKVGKLHSNPAIDNNIFKQAQNEIYILMEMDLLPKFLKSDIFKAEFNYSRNRVKETLFIVVDCVTSFISQFDSPAKSSEIRHNILSIGANISLLFQEQKLSEKKFLDEMKPLLHTLCDKVIDSYEISFAFSPDEVIDSLKKVQLAFEKIVKPHLAPHIMLAIQNMFKYLSDEGLIISFFKKRKWKETKEVIDALRKLWDDELV